MDRVIRKIIDGDFSDLEGFTAELSIPLRQHLINEMIESALHGNKDIESCQVSILSQNRVSVVLKATLWPWPLHLKLRLDKSVDFASYASPKMRAWLENNRLLGSIGSFFNALPEAIKLYGDQVVVDLGVFLRTPAQKRMLNLIKSVDIKTEEGKINLDVKLQVD
ncbi:MAG: hypothetical protein ACXW4E_02760 [Anaerolineales bacterium]